MLIISLARSYFHYNYFCAEVFQVKIVHARAYGDFIYTLSTLHGQFSLGK